MFHEVKGKIREIAGEVSDNPKLEATGTYEIGQVKKGWGDSESGVSCKGVSLDLWQRLHDKPQPGLRKHEVCGIKKFKKQ